MPFEDLPPRDNPKGGSPRTPPGIPVREYEGYVSSSNGSIWKMATSVLSGLTVGLVVAYFTAMSNKGVNQSEMQSYVDKYSPYAHDKEVIALQQSTQDQKIGELIGKWERIVDRLGKMDEKNVNYDRDSAEQEKKLQLIADYLEEEKKAKR